MLIQVLLLICIQANRIQMSDLEKIESTHRIESLRKEFQHQFEKLSQQNDELRQQIQLQQTELQIQQTQLQDHQKQIKYQQEKLEQFEKNRSMLVENAIAFSAHIGENNLGVTVDQVVVFSGIYTNIGGHYDDTTGYFTCPVQGIYIFALSFLTDTDRSITLQIAKSTNSIIETFSAPHANNNDNEAATCVVVIECSQNSVVYVKSNGESVIAGRSHTTFSGYLLQIS